MKPLLYSLCLLCSLLMPSFKLTETSFITPASNTEAETLAEKKKFVYSIVMYLAKFICPKKIDTRPDPDTLQIPFYFRENKDSNKYCDLVAKLDLVSSPPYLLLDECFYDKCAQKFKEKPHQFRSALAIILAHELVHYQNKMGCGFRTDCNKDRGNRLKAERRADTLALWNTALAGYDISIADETYKLMYETAKIEENRQSCYPKLAERLATIKDIQKTITKLHQDFEIAKMLYCFEAFPEAARRFEDISKIVKDPEVLYNTAVAKIQWALDDMRQLPDSCDLKKWAFFDYPLEINAKSRVSNKRSGHSTDTLVIKKRLKEAAVFLDKMPKVNRDTSWILTRATLYLLLKDVKQGEKLLESFKSKLHFRISGVAVLYGLFAYMQKDKANAQKIFAKLRTEQTFCRDRFNTCLSDIFMTENLNERLVKDCRIKAGCPSSENIFIKQPDLPAIKISPNGHVESSPLITRCRVNTLAYSYSKSVNSPYASKLEGLTIGKTIWTDNNLPEVWRNYDNVILTREGTVAYYLYRNAQILIEARATGAKKEAVMSGWYIMGQ